MWLSGVIGSLEVSTRRDLPRVELDFQFIRKYYAEMILSILIASPDKSLVARFKRAIEAPDLLVQTAFDSFRIWDDLAHSSHDLILVDQVVLDDNPGLIATARDLPDAPEVVTLVGREDAEQRAQLLSKGCIAVISKGLPSKAVRGALAAVIARRRDARKALHQPPHTPSALPRLGNLVTNSPIMQAFLKVANRVARSDTSLLVLGETGAGKEWLARAIHAESPRSTGPFVTVNCGAMPESLLESELFGHEEGSFTNAIRTRRGMFELAHGGTIFLDEIGEMPLHLQVKLLGVLQSREVQRLGAERPQVVDVRIMAATNLNPAAEVEAGRFRRDLYYRLSVVTLVVPPLRERREDISNLALRYLHHFRTQFVHSVESFSRPAMDALLAYDWPGNIRELINVVERSTLLGEGERIELDDLPEELSGPSGRAGHGSTDRIPEVEPKWLDRSFKEAKAAIVEQFEYQYLTHVLRKTSGRVGRAASHAGLSQRALYTKMKEHGLRKEDFRRGLD